MLHPHPSRRFRPTAPCRGDRGVAIILTSLLLIPLMLAAAFGVDIASFHSRVGQLQRAADAAALAGTVWMPDLAKARVIATESLAKNGVVDGADDDITVVIEPGEKLNSLSVTITDSRVTTFFSNVINHRQVLVRSAEAQYNLQLPLGSPLNYFGGDRTKTGYPTQIDYSVVWPADYATRAPYNPACNIGTSPSQELGRWAGSSPSFRADEFGSGDPECRWRAQSQGAAGTTNVPPPDYQTRPPNNGDSNGGCRVREDGNGTVLGRWRNPNGGQPYAFYSDTSGSAGACVWDNAATQAASLPAGYATEPARNQPCRVGWGTNEGYWNGTYSAAVPGSVVGGAATAGNRLCEWGPRITSTDTTPPNPIAADRSPGFWAAIGGPGDVAAFGDAYSAKCTGSTNCGSTSNAMYSDDGYWYVIKMPASGTTSTSLRIFDAAYNTDASSTTLTGDTRGSFGSGSGFTTTFRVYRQTNPFDFTARTALGPDTANQTAGSCHWSLRDQVQFRRQWIELCPLTPSAGEIYLLNVKTSGSSDSDGVNGYAVEAVASGTVQPAVYAYGSMGMRNNISAGEAEFYLAEVGPQYAGKTLVIELFDAGDASGNAFLRPVLPGTALSGPSEFTDVPSSWCRYTASPFPNPGIYSGSPAGERTSASVTDPTQPSLSNCQIQTTASGTQRFNDEWLSIRVAIPTTYSCTLGLNPETQTGTCWWGIKYDFSADSNDVTTWKAGIEGNPVHLTK